MNKENARKLVFQIVKEYKKELDSNLIGIYLHGSLAMDCFNYKMSDIDFLVVVKKNIDINVKRKLIDILLENDKAAPKKGFEMSVVLKKDIINFTYPTNYILHYSNTYKEDYLKNKSFFIGPGEDSDLAAHMYIIKFRGECLYGEPINLLFDNIKKKYYLDSIVLDALDADNGINLDPVYYILNLCRVLCFLKEEKICSKEEGAIWAIDFYKNMHKEKYLKIIKNALAKYRGLKYEDFINEKLLDFKDCILNEIKLLYKKELENEK